MEHELVTKFNQWLEVKNITRTCPACGAEHWAEPQQVIAPKRFTGFLWDAKDPQPTIETVCPNCGYTAYFRLKSMGIAWPPFR